MEDSMKDIVSTAAYRLPDGTMEPATVNGETLAEFERAVDEYLWVFDVRASVSAEDYWLAGDTAQEAARKMVRGNQTMPIGTAPRAEEPPVEDYDCDLGEDGGP